MKKIKINIDRAKVSKEEIDSKRNFDNILKQVMGYSKPFYKTKLFLNSILVILFTTTVAYTVLQLEKKVREIKEHENDGYAQISAVKEIGSNAALKTQEFVVQIDKDTVLNTAQGAVIKIPAGSLQSTDKNVVLLLKEAYTLEDMIRAGLTTKSGKDLLSSGGMFYIHAKDSVHVKIIKPLAINIPTEEVNEDMKLYKGDITPTGKIDWQEPVELRKDTARVVSEGETLFKDNCTSCHKLGAESVGPDLAYIGKRRDFDWLSRYIKNNAIMRAHACVSVSEEVSYVESESVSTNVVYKQNTGQDYSAPSFEESGIDYSNDEYAICLYEAYKKAEMTAFPTLGDKEIKALCDYFNDESKRLKLPYPKDELYINFQKCKTYKTLMSELYTQKSVLQSKRSNKIIDNGLFVKEVNRSIRQLQMPDNAASISNEDRKSYIYPVNKQAEYYQVEINTFGWYNIDMMVKNLTGVKESKLFVEVSDSFANTFQIYLVIPDVKIYGAGGLLKDKKDVYGFYEDNGTIKLPQGKTAHVYLVGEKDGQLLYAATTFITDTLNTLRLDPVLIPKETFNQKIKELLKAEGMSVKAGDSKNAAVLRKIDTNLTALEEKIKEAEKLAPKDCDCGCDVKPVDVVIGAKEIMYDGF
jgi:hypothetical protein